LSFLVLQVPAARNIWIWLTLGTLVVVATLWHLDTVLLLAQPAVYGLILPLVAVLFDRTLDRRTVVPDTLSGRGYQLALPGTDDSESAATDDRETVPSTLVRPAALSDSGAS
jgi:hypothetical protein